MVVAVRVAVGSSVVLVFLTIVNEYVVRFPPSGSGPYPPYKRVAGAPPEGGV